MMADTTDLLARADSLIRAEPGPARDDRRGTSLPLRRRRTFIASAAAPVGEPEALAAAEDHEDLPLLTEVVPPDATTVSRTRQAGEFVLRTKLAANLAESVGRRLQQQLPELVDAALRAAADQLSRGIGEAMQSAVADFLDQRGQLNLPLDPPGDGRAAVQAPALRAEDRSDPV
ncbi:hypothetical protein [Accumulibacter sp.]|uniref:hypothetical protein n=1 Tax=Accumulibacter sp. TaxID=2053492 RepID=UPI0025EBD211|nr:hypothetical protein [Accumulibacter sp.]MCM8595813.1 hypothetical protein [Accumulibacter sp.]MCM8626534.1 hypothetical protein [Accumulibacter sp.]MDS4049961.1 hypothetical protein [Accumulibacter sp.]